MVRVKVNQGSQVQAGDEHDSTIPSRRTRRQTKSRVEHQHALISDNEDLEDAEAARAPSSSPVAKLRAKRKYRKGDAAMDAPSNLADDASPETTPQLAKDGRRKGGNKRKWTHEYCLTCTNYGRACGGRRDGEPGCAMCREPNREKGEKLRECLWADPKAGIHTYQEAREVHKKAQAEARATRAKPPKRPVPTVDHTRAEIQSPTCLTTPDPLGIVAHPGATGGSQPQLSRPLDVLPPRAGIAQAPSVNGYRTHSSSHGPQAQINQGDTVTVNTARHARRQSHPELPRVHAPQVIDLPNSEEAQDGHSHRTAMPQPAHYFPPPTLPPGLSPLPEAFAPYYNPKQRAYILPVYPHSNLLPPPAFMRDHAATYISPYDAHPSIPLSMTGRYPPQAVSPVVLPPRNTGFSIPQPLKFRNPKSQPLDSSSAPCRKWSRSDSKVTTLSGYEFKSKGWKRGVNSSENGEASEIATNGSNAVSSNAVSIETATRWSAASSELSSAIDVDETMLATTPQNNNEDEDGDSPVRPQQIDDETESEDEEEDPDRAQAFLKMFCREKEKMNGLKRKRSPSSKIATPTETAARPVAVDADGDGSDETELTEPEGREKVGPADLRNTAAKATTFDDAWESSSASAPKVQAGRGRAARASTSSSNYEDAAEQPAPTNGFAAVNSKRNAAASLERKRKILAALQDGDIEMDEA